MRLAEQLQLPAGDRSDLFYALLMKDAGCSSNAARVSQLFGGNDQEAKRGLWERDWRRWREKIRRLTSLMRYRRRGPTAGRCHSTR